ncbi:Gfo/Idh/MocA family oxidoreductase [Candidatus Babeliales bacterium]|nr:Gfo/Idh/MocA family oxidoreductase [Candidatus Babeliales bacterium]
MMVKLGIIGLGHMGTYHASVSTSISNMELTCIADPNIKNLAKIKSAKVVKTQNYQEWIDYVDAVIIAVPTSLHFEIAKECLLRKKHVLLEKPLTRTLEQAQELFNIAKENNVSLHVGHVERFNGAVQELRKIVNNPYLIECHRLGPFTARPQKDSVVLDLMIHDLDIILSLIDSPLKTFNAVGTSIKTNTGDIAIVQLKFENGAVANIVSSRVSQIKHRSMSVHQKGCVLQLDYTAQDISIHSNITDSVKVSNKQLKYKQEGTIKRLFVYKDNPLRVEVENFIKCIRSGKRNLKPEQDMKALGLAIEIENLLLGKKPVKAVDRINHISKNETSDTPTN